MLIKTSDASCVINNFLTILGQEVWNFHVSGSITRKKALEMGKRSLVYRVFNKKWSRWQNLRSRRRDTERRQGCH